MTMNIEYPDQKINNFFKELETHKTILTTITDTHTKLINTFTSLDETLFKKSLILDTQIVDFENKRQETLETLDSREKALPERESTLAASVKAFEESFNDEESQKTTTLGKLQMFFRRMDSTGLVNFLLEKRRQSYMAREDLAKGALDCIDLLTFVLDAVEEFVRLKMSAVKVKGMTDRRWAYGLLMHTALALPNHGVARNLKERAWKVLETWKGVLSESSSDGTGSGEATMFLQMVSAFGLKHKFDDQFLMNMVKEFAAGRDMAKVALALGYRDKMGDIIEELVKKGKEIEAVYFVHEAELTEQYPPVPLLESNLKKYREITCKVSSSLDDVSNEMSVIRTVIKCIEDNKLESQFTIADLETRLSELEKIRARKRSGTTSTSTTSNKRPRSEKRGSGSSRPPKAVRLALARKKLLAERAPHQQSATTLSAPYSSYGAGNGYPSSQTSGSYGRQYAYPSQDINATATHGV